MSNMLVNHLSLAPKGSPEGIRETCFYIRCVFVRVRVCVCVFLGKGRGGGTPHMHGHKESYKDLNLKILTSEWDSNPRPHEY